MPSTTMRVSVIIPAYNYGHFLPDCLDSVLGQTVAPEEIIVVDDGSTDNTPDVVQAYLSEHLVRYIRIENSGVSAARNTGIAASNGDIIGLLDADDKWRNDKLELQLPLFCNPKIGVVYSLHQPFDEKGLVSEYRRSKPQRGQILDALLRNNVVPLSSALVRKVCLEKVGMFNESFGICADYDLWNRMAIHSVEFDYVNQPLMMYRTHQTSMLTDISWKYRENYMVLCELFEGIGKGVCTVEMKRAAWAFYFAKCANGHYEMNNRWNALTDAIRSIYYGPSGVLDKMAWRVLFKSVLPQTIVTMLQRRRARTSP